MTHQLPVQENYYDLKLELRSLWKIHDEVGFELFPSPFQALYEITVGLQQVFPMRKLCLFQKGFHPYAEELALRFAKQGYRIEWIEQDGESLDRFKEKTREILFLLYSEDQPFSGEYLDAKALKRFRDFSSFNLALNFIGNAKRSELVTPEPMQAIIHVLSDGRSVATLGSRLRITLTLSSHLPEPFLSLADWKNARMMLIEDEALVKEAEAYGVKTLSAQPYPLSHPRYFDRALFSFEDIDASSLRSLMIERDQKYRDLLPFGLNFHRSDKSLKWMVQGDTTVEDLQGRLAAPLTVLGESFTRDLKESVQEIRNLQILTL